MIPAALVAAAINGLCLKLLASDRPRDVTVRAAWTFSINDFVSNLGAMIAGTLVLLVEQSWPDLVVGAAVAFVALYSGVQIVRDAQRGPA